MPLSPTSREGTEESTVLVALSTAWGSGWQLKKTWFPAVHPAAAVCILPQPESQLLAGVNTRVCRGTLPSAAPSSLRSGNHSPGFVV